MAKNPCKWQIFNTQSSVYCQGFNLERHSIENEKILRLLEHTAETEDTSWIVKSTYTDPAHKQQKATYRLVGTYDLRNLVNDADLKNGFDIGFKPSSSTTIAFITHGKKYPFGKRDAHITQIMHCRLLDRKTSRLIEKTGFLSENELKRLYHAKEKHVSLKPCIQSCLQEIQKQVSADSATSKRPSLKVKAERS